ncbi:hypothetical protein Tco_1135470 [Tanacetum coccineum]
MMTSKYCPRNEIKKLDMEIWELKVKDRKVCRGLPDMIIWSVMPSKVKIMQDAIEFAAKLMDKKIRTFAEGQAENKRKFEDTSKNNQIQQQQNKRQNTGRAYTAGHREKECPKLKNNNQGNPTGNDNAPAKVYAVGHAETNPDSNVVTGNGYQQKGRKQSQNDKTEHGMEKTMQNQGQRPKKSKSKSIQKNQQSNQNRN